MYQATGAALDFPTGHFVHADASTAPNFIWYFPASQFVHVVEDVAPSVVEYFPCTQSSHAIAASALENFPA